MGKEELKYPQFVDNMTLCLKDFQLWGGSDSKDTVAKTTMDLQNPHGRRREPTPASCLLTHEHYDNFATPTHIKEEV